MKNYFNKPVKILILEDVPEDVGLVERVLTRDGLPYVTKKADTRDEFVNALHDFVPDVILSDHALPQFNSIEALKISQGLGRRIPFILVTGAVSEEFAVNCLKQGADDYVLKSNLVRLPQAIFNSIKQRDAQDEKKKAEEHLRQQNSQLLKINMELDNFVYSISHNLRSPLASVLGLLNLAKREESSNAELPRLFAMMESSVRKLDTTLQGILEYSQNNRNLLEVSKIALDELINDCFEHLTYLDGFHRVERYVEVSQDPFFSDRDRVSVLLRNLISNSIKYADPNKSIRSVRITAAVSPRDVVIVVEDNGIGIADEYHSRVFDMFYRATEHAQGAGLGLYIAKEIIQVLNGSYKLTSAVNHGTTFTITLPNLGDTHSPA